MTYFEKLLLNNKQHQVHTQVREKGRQQIHRRFRDQVDDRLWRQVLGQFWFPKQIQVFSQTHKQINEDLL